MRSFVKSLNLSLDSDSLLFTDQIFKTSQHEPSIKDSNVGIPNICFKHLAELFKNLDKRFHSKAWQGVCFKTSSKHFKD